MREFCSNHNCKWRTTDLWVLGAAFAAGLVTHGYMLVNKLSFHDDIYELFAPGQTFIAGRWVLGLLAKTEDVILGSASLPLWNGLLCIVLLGLAGAVLARLYDLQNRTSLVLVGCAVVVMPSVVSLMGFMFTAHYYALAFLLGCVGASCLCRARSWQGILAGIVSIVLALGIYQASLPLVCAVMVLWYMQDVLRGNHKGPRFWIHALCYLAEVAAAMGIYGGIALLCMRTLGNVTTTTDYAGLSEVGHTTIGTYLSRAVLAYREFLHPEAEAIYNQYPGSIRSMYEVLLVILAVLVLRRAVLAVRGGQIDDTIHYVLLALLMPLCMNLMFVMTEVKWIHAITVYAEVLIPVWLVTELETQGKTGAQGRGSGWLRNLSLFVAGLMVIAYVRYGNLCYLKAEFLQAEAASYFNQLIARIQSVDSYSPEMPVVYLHEQDKQADTLYDMSGFEDVITSPYNYDTLINDYAWKEFMRYWCDYDPIVYPAGEEDTWSQEIQNMPRYPADGSIQVFEPGYIVVKF